MQQNYTERSQPADTGPIYKETNMSRLPVEPFNTVSNLIFLAVAIYWIKKTRFDMKKYPVTSFAMPILLLGYIGGTIFHATRSHNLWLFMDYMAIMVLVLLASVYMWKTLVNNWALTFILTLGPVFIYRIFSKFIVLSHQASISLGYSVLAINVVLPAILHCIYRNPKGWKALMSASAAFIVAIGCRQADSIEPLAKFLPMGTHFLWHIFGGISAFFLAEYLFKSEKIVYENGFALKPRLQQEIDRS
ncbi:MAG: hypothetical protein WC071_10690 [Victivallaceae bacterium]